VSAPGKRIDVTALGEILIDFTSAGTSEAGQTLYERNAGGAPANVAVAVSRLGGISAFVGMTGSDSFGTYLRDTLDRCSVDTRGMQTCEDCPTTLAFVTLSSGGERTFSFYRNPGADTRLAPEQLDSSLLSASRFLHVGSLSLTHEPARSATMEAISLVKKAGGYISYDPNWRQPLWQDEATGLHAMHSLFEYADIVKVSEEELLLLFDTDDYSLGAQKILDNGARLVLVTLGPKGVFYKNTASEGTIPVPPVSVKDTTGAGDSFMGGLLYRLSRTPYPEDPFLRSRSELEGDILFANAVAALCVQKRGAIPAMPSRNEVEVFLSHNR